MSSGFANCAKILSSIGFFRNRCLSHAEQGNLSRDTVFDMLEFRGLLSWNSTFQDLDVAKMKEEGETCKRNFCKGER